MTRTLRILMRRDPSRDRHDSQIYLEGYAILWPDGRPLGVGFDAFCNQGLRYSVWAGTCAGAGRNCSTSSTIHWPDLRMP